MPNVRFYVNEDKANKKGYIPIKAVVTIKGKNIAKVIGTVKKENWDNDNKRIKKHRTPQEYYDAETLNAELSEFKYKTELFMHEQKKKGIELTPEMLRNYFDGKQDTGKDISLWKVWDEFIRISSLTKTQSTVKSQIATKNYYKEFEESTGTKVSFDNINLVFNDKFVDYVLNQKKHHYNYLATLNRRFKAFLNWSFNRGYYNGIDHNRFKIPEKPGTVVTLTIDEFQQFYRHEFKSKRLEKVRDIFCFGCLTGLRISDLMRLNRENLQNGYLVTYMKKIKNDKPLQIPILSQAKRILDKYQEQYYLLPRISDQKFNTYIKEAAAAAGITAPVKIMHFKSGTGEETTITKDQLIHAHMTRKTFITLAYKAGLDIESIKAITGIKAEKTLQRYLTIEPETLSDKIKAFSDMIGD